MQTAKGYAMNRVVKATNVKVLPLSLSKGRLSRYTLHMRMVDVFVDDGRHSFNYTEQKIRTVIILSGNGP